MFDGEPRLFELGGGSGWVPLPPSAGYVEGSRGIGLLDFLTATADRPARAGGEVALHVLEVMTAVLRSAEEGRRIPLTTTVARPAPVPLTPAETWRA